MSSRKLFLIDPYNDNHLSLVEDFELTNDTDRRISNFLKRIKTHYSKEEYKEKKKVSNEVEEALLYTENDKVLDAVHLSIEKDIKACRMFFAPINATRERRIIKLATDYALNELGLEEVFVETKGNKIIINTLNQLGYENLGEENGKIVFLKDNDERLIRQRKI